MPAENPFARIAREAAALPEDARPAFLSEAVGREIPFVATAGLAVEVFSDTRVACRLDGRPPVRNHVGGLHAAAMALLAETASGLVVACNVTAESVPVLRRMEIDYRKRVEGALSAEATLVPDDARRIRTTQIGKIDVPVRLYDAAGRTPLDAVLQWVWLPKRKVRR